MPRLELSQVRPVRRQFLARRVAAVLAGAGLVAAGALTFGVGTAGAVTTCTTGAPLNNCLLYDATGANQSFTVPKGVTLVAADVRGSGGGVSSYSGAAGGNGGRVVGSFAVTPGQVLNLTVGSPTFGGGGQPGGNGERGVGGTGGGLSAVWSGEPFTTGAALIVAGGGGGASGATGNDLKTGGDGGGPAGGDGTAVAGSQFGGKGGTQSAGGDGGEGGGTAGSRFQGGDGSDGDDSGGGGGGGWFGGGGGHGQVSEDDDNNDGGGGGGSGYVSPDVAVTSVDTGSGSPAGNAGQIALAFVAPAPTISSPTNAAQVSGTAPVTGSAVPGTLLTLRVDGSGIRCAQGDPLVVPENGTWTCTPATAIVAGVHSIDATQADPDSPLAVYPASNAVEITVPGPAVTAPGAPQRLTVTPGNGSAVLTFSAPTSDGGSPIIGYRYSIDGGRTFQPLDYTGDGPYSATITGLDNGTSYQVQVLAVNIVGSGPTTTAAPVVPRGPTTSSAPSTTVTSALSPPSSTSASSTTPSTSGAVAPTSASTVSTTPTTPTTPILAATGVSGVGGLVGAGALFLLAGSGLVFGLRRRSSLHR